MRVRLRTFQKLKVEFVCEYICYKLTENWTFPLLDMVDGKKINIGDGCYEMGL